MPLPAPCLGRRGALLAFSPPAAFHPVASCLGLLDLLALCERRALAPSRAAEGESGQSLESRS